MSMVTQRNEQQTNQLSGRGLANILCISILSFLQILGNWLIVCGRSVCSLVCKWLHEADESKRGWNEEFLRDIGLADLTADGFRKIGRSFSCYYDTVVFLYFKSYI